MDAEDYRLWLRISEQRWLKYANVNNLVIMITKPRQIPCHPLSFFSSDTIALRFLIASLSIACTEVKVVFYYRYLTICTTKAIPPKNKKGDRCGSVAAKQWRWKREKLSWICSSLPGKSTYEKWEMATPTIGEVVLSDLNTTKSVLSGQAWFWRGEIRWRIYSRSILPRIS